MREYTIECAGVETARQLHELLRRELNFPEWYGHNLDALHDLLTALGEPTRLIMKDFFALPNFSLGFRLVLNDCEEENPNLFVDLK